ncbi:hypothetical protein [Algoriphagus persicinus]|uniref:hypothetical protein n=1 Tax=Algoriphagus persicinus TaxID=3108754 RepID=UPI002B37CB74|nr:hypothetical protein [Algoriphagus sp. E1-3-M2]MEB2785364.1 hypothetical protein [Algoriphagus sp. E1-3-M2]
MKDIFIFSCYTGICYIDAMNLTPDDIVLGLDGRLLDFNQPAENPPKIQSTPIA